MSLHFTNVLESWKQFHQLLLPHFHLFFPPLLPIILFPLPYLVKFIEWMILVQNCYCDFVPWHNPLEHCSRISTIRAHRVQSVDGLEWENGLPCAILCVLSLLRSGVCRTSLVGLVRNGLRLFRIISIVYLILRLLPSMVLVLVTNPCWVCSDLSFLRLRSYQCRYFLVLPKGPGKESLVGRPSVPGPLDSSCRTIFRLFLIALLFWWISRGNMFKNCYAARRALRSVFEQVKRWTFRKA